MCKFSGLLASKTWMLITSSHLNCLVVSLFFSMGRKAKDGEPQVIANLWAGVLMYKGLKDGDPVSDWSSLGWIVPFSFCQNNLNTTNPHQAILQTFCVCHYFLTSEQPSSLDSFCLRICYWPTFKMISKKPSKPGFANDLGFSGPKIAREPHEKLLWFFFLGMETHWVS